jgi:hypothetical protein
MHLESRRLAPGTINLRLEAVRRLAFEAAGCVLLSADWAAGVRRVKGVTKTRREAGQLVNCPTGVKLSGRLQIATGSRANGIGPCLQCFLLVRSVATNSPGRPGTRWGAILRGISTREYEEFFRRGRRRRVCRAFGEPGSGPSQRRTVETLRAKRWDIIEILALPSVASLDGT